MSMSVTNISIQYIKNFPDYYYNSASNLAVFYFFFIQNSVTEDGNILDQTQTLKTMPDLYKFAIHIMLILMHLAKHK